MVDTGKIHTNGDFCVLFVYITCQFKISAEIIRKCQKNTNNRTIYHYVCVCFFS